MAWKLGSIDDLARVQFSLVTREQLLASDFSGRTIAALLRSGSLRSVQPGIYATLGSVRSWEQGLMASVLAAGEGAAASHSSAARLWNFVHRPEYEIAVVLECDFTPKAHGIHRTTILPEDDISERSGIPCTSFERTLCDCTTLLTPFQLGRVLDDGLRRGDASLVRLQRCAARLDSGPRRRLVAIKGLLAQRDPSFDPGGSGSELDVLQVIRDAGLPVPVQQFEIRARGRTYFLDFAWPDQRVFAEYYGLAVHSGASAVAYDSRRVTAVAKLGWRPMLWTQATSDREIIEDVAEALSTAP